MTSPIHSPIPPPAQFQAHVYNSFLQGKTSDVALTIRGTWHAVYKFHRVVLIQAEFFRHLFTGGFAESEPKDSLSRSRVPPDPIEVVFDDTNITRAGTLCVARLYGGGPPLFVDPAIVPTPSQPLTPSFPTPLPPAPVPLGHHPATPRFLLSLLAVSIYLSMPTIGPLTVVDYLRFACGEGIGPLQEEDLDPLVGLEHVAQLVKDDTTLHAVPSRRKHPTAADAGGLSRDLETLSVIEEAQSSRASSIHGVDLSVEKEDPADLSSDSGSPVSCFAETAPEFSFSYGAVSDKIGEACVCWLAKWGADVLVYERQAGEDSKYAAPFVPASTPARAIGRRSTVSGWRTPAADVVAPPSKVPLIWRRGGLTATWVRALVSSDSLFVKGERERYDLAKTVVEMRRSECILEEEEIEWEKMFTEGIYYANMTFDDLVYVSQDRSPTTGRLYVPAHVVQSAHWMQSVLHHKVVGPSPSSPPASPTGTSRSKELGVFLSPKEIEHALSGPEKEVERTRPYWPVPGPSSLRIGESAGIEGASMDELFELPSASSNPRGVNRSSMTMSNFFGLKTERTIATECVTGNPADSARWVPYPPYRFAVEFWDVDALREKSHLYSQTIWYAGSLFNVFVQMFRKKSQGAQLGVYLHRQSSVDPIPPLSVPSGMYPTEKQDSTKPHARNLSSPSSMTLASSSPIQYSFSGLPMLPSPRPGTPLLGSPSTSSLSSNGLPATAPSVIPLQPYRDPRAQVSAYFSISCASATGSSLTRFTSNPDDFSISQSWGWRSSSLRTEVCVEPGSSNEYSPTSPSGDGSVRVTVTLGVV
ncbi:hypothetical protein BC834DRAFT_860437 [Gloeopeniophorella convolvens]|nr:hypothetical protein BC834DRAFT_860437 [Gloeopeniophorella convolvens]